MQTNYRPSSVTWKVDVRDVRRRTDLDEKSVEVKWVIVNDNAACIANDFKNAAG